jgi:hypothetical protein
MCGYPRDSLTGTSSSSVVAFTGFRLPIVLIIRGRVHQFLSRELFSEQTATSLWGNDTEGSANQVPVWLVHFLQSWIAINPVEGDLSEICSTIRGCGTRKGAIFLIIRTGEKTDIISSWTELKSPIFVAIFHKRSFFRINLERKKQLVWFPSQSDLMKNARTGLCLPHHGCLDALMIRSFELRFYYVWYASLLCPKWICCHPGIDDHPRRCIKCTLATGDTQNELNWVEAHQLHSIDG